MQGHLTIHNVARIRYLRHREGTWGHVSSSMYYVHELNYLNMSTINIRLRVGAAKQITLYLSRLCGLLIFRMQEVLVPKSSDRICICCAVDSLVGPWHTLHQYSEGAAQQVSYLETSLNVLIPMSQACKSHVDIRQHKHNFGANSINSSHLSTTFIVHSPADLPEIHRPPAAAASKVTKTSHPTHLST